MAFIGKTRDPAFQYYADQTTLDLARRLRRKLTPSERKLWQSLRSNKITGFKFRRQHPVNYYIADFYCHQAKLVIEVMARYINIQIAGSTINSGMESWRISESWSCDFQMTKFGITLTMC